MQLLTIINWLFSTSIAVLIHIIICINNKNIRYQLEKFSCLKLYRYYDLRVKRILTICEHSFLVFIKLFSREVSKREERTLNLATSLLSLMIWLIHFRVWQLERVFVWYLILQKMCVLWICFLIFLCSIAALNYLQSV